MSKLAFVKDLHAMLGLVKPLSRTDSFHKDMRVKYLSLRDKLTEMEVTHLVFTGDLFQVKAPSKYDINALALYDELFLEILGDFKKYTIRGNHDIYMTKEGLHRNSIFELGLTHKWYETLEGSPLVLDDIVVYGIDFRRDVEELKSELESLSDIAIKQNFLGKKTAVVVHEHLVPTTKDMFLNSYILYDYFSELSFDLVVGGHLHKGYPTKTVGECTIINTWSFCRLVRDHYSVDDKHKPCFSYVNIENQKIETRNIAVKHRPYESAFTSTIISETNLMGNISAFKSKIAQAGDLSGISLDLIRESSGALEVDSELLNKSIEYIETLLDDNRE
jgi:predicted phosphodiesterase